jgi:hypothetical protein
MTWKDAPFGHGKEDRPMMKRDLKNRSLDEFFVAAVKVNATNAPSDQKVVGLKLDTGPKQSR